MEFQSQKHTVYTVITEEIAAGAHPFLGLRGIDYLPWLHLELQVWQSQLHTKTLIAQSLGN